MGIKTGWSDTISSFLNDTYIGARTFENLITNMFTTVLHKFNDFVAEVLASDLWYALFGGGKTMEFGTATFLFGGKVAKSRRDPGWLLDLQRTIPYTAPSKDYYTPELSTMGSQKAAVGSTVINITNKGTPVTLKETSRVFDGRRWVINAVMSELNTNPAFAKTVRGG